jgi:hypothetical protein
VKRRGACAHVGAAEADGDEDCIMIQVDPGGLEPLNPGVASSGIVFNTHHRSALGQS